MAAFFRPCDFHSGFLEPGQGPDAGAGQVIDFSNFKDEEQQDEAIFDNFNNRVWQTLRIKPPVPQNDAWWRIEFRPMAMQFGFNFIFD